MSHNWTWGRLPRPYVLPRALVTAAVALVCGGVAHVSAGGLVPGLMGTINISCAVFAVTILVVQTRGPSLQVVWHTVCLQMFAHLAMSWLGGHHEVEPGHSTVGAPTVYPSSLTDLLAHTVEDPAMLAWHTAAAALVGIWLACSEAWLWELLALTLGRALRVVRAVVAPVPLRQGLTRGGLVWRDDQRLRNLVLAAAPSRRGPPCAH